MKYVVAILLAVGCSVIATMLAKIGVAPEFRTVGSGGLELHQRKPTKSTKDCVHGNR